MGNSCNLFIEGKGKISVTIDDHPSLPKMTMTGTNGRGMRDVVYGTSDIRCAIRQAGFNEPMANMHIHIDESAKEFGSECIKNAIAQGIVIASGQATIPDNGYVTAEPIQIDGSSLELKNDSKEVEFSLDDLCEAKDEEAEIANDESGILDASELSKGER